MALKNRTGKPGGNRDTESRTVPKKSQVGTVCFSSSANVVAFTPPVSGAQSLQNGKVGRTMPPTRRSNAEVRTREYLTAAETDRLMAAAGKTGRHGHRDATIILLAYRHGLRVSELIALRWDQVDLRQGLFYVSRLKNGTPSVHPLRPTWSGFLYLAIVLDVWSRRIVGWPWPII